MGSVSFKNVLRMKKTTPSEESTSSEVSPANDLPLSAQMRSPLQSGLKTPVEYDKWGSLPFTVIQLIFTHAASWPPPQFRKFLSAVSQLNHYWKDTTDSLIERLDLKKIWSGPLESVLRRFNHTKKLRLTSIDVDSFLTLSHHNQLSELELHAIDFQSSRMIRALMRIPFITSLIFRNSPSVDDRVVRALIQCVSLRTLDFTGCSLVTEDGARSIQKITTLEHLYLADCSGISTEGLLGLSSLTKLRTLNLSGVHTVANSVLHGLSTMINLSDLDIFMCPNITDTGLWYLARNNSLQSLNVFSCDKITDEGLRAIAQHQKLQTLNIGWCCLISDAGLKFLCRLLSLRELRLSCVSITVEGLLSLAKLERLSLLDLRGCDISPMQLTKGIKVLREMYGDQLTILRT
eukprot:g647.t1